MGRANCQAFGLSRPVVAGLALWMGMVVVHARRLTAVADGWACRLGQRFDAVRERLRDTYREADAKAGGRPRIGLGGLPGAVAAQ